MLIGACNLMLCPMINNSPSSAGGPEAAMFGVARSCLNGAVKMRRATITQATERCDNEHCVTTCDGWDKGHRTQRCMMDLWLLYVPNRNGPTALPAPHMSHLCAA